MSTHAKIINVMVNLYQKNIMFAYLFCLIAIGIWWLLYCMPTTIISVILGVIWWGFSLSMMVESLVVYKYKSKK